MNERDVDHRAAALSLAALAIICVEKAWGITRRAALRIKPLVTPPSSLRVDAGGPLYSGVILIDRNEVIFGVVVQTGYEPPTGSSAAALRPPLITPTAERQRFSPDDPREVFGDRNGMLPSWAETDDDYRGAPWRR